MRPDRQTRPLPSARVRADDHRQTQSARCRAAAVPRRATDLAACRRRRFATGEAQRREAVPVALDSPSARAGTASERGAAAPACQSFDVRRSRPSRRNVAGTRRVRSELPRRCGGRGDRRPQPTHPQACADAKADRRGRSAARRVEPVRSASPDEATAERIGLLCDRRCDGTPASRRRSDRSCPRSRRGACAVLGGGQRGDQRCATIRRCARRVGSRGGGARRGRSHLLPAPTDMRSDVRSRRPAAVRLGAPALPRARACNRARSSVSSRPAGPAGSAESEVEYTPHANLRAPASLLLLRYRPAGGRGSRRRPRPSPRAAAEVARARPLAADALERGEQPRRGRLLAEVVEHQDGAPDGAARVRDALAGDVGRRAVHGLEQPRHVAARAEVGARGHAHAALQGRAEIGQDVAEEVRGDDDVEAVGPQHHARRERVHEHVLVADAGMARGHLGGDLVPEHVAVARGVRLGRARDQPAPLAGERGRRARRRARCPRA